MSEHKPDLIREIMLRLQQSNALFTDDVALLIEAQVRAEWGGQWVYVAKRRGLINRKAAEQLPDIETVSRRLQVSLRHARRLIKNNGR